MDSEFTIYIDSAESKIYALVMTHFFHKQVNEKGELEYQTETKIIAALETKDQQIDFNFLEVFMDEEEKTDYRLI